MPGDPYELRIATGSKARKVMSVESNIASLNPAMSTEEGLVRVRVTVPAKDPAEWHWAVKME